MQKETLDAFVGAVVGGCCLGIALTLGIDQFTRNMPTCEHLVICEHLGWLIGFFIVLGVLLFYWTGSRLCQIRLDDVRRKHANDELWLGKKCK